MTDHNLISRQNKQPKTLRKAYSLTVSIAAQQLKVNFTDNTTKRYVVSTAANGINCEENSFGTPVGWHAICQKIGDGEPPGRVFEARQPTARIVKPVMEAVTTNEDLVVTRILWLEGLEEGVNRGEGCDSKNRYIYIHGTQEEGLIGRPVSHGCIRMTSNDIIELFTLVEVSTRVLIIENQY